MRDLHGPTTVIEEFFIAAFAIHWDRFPGRRCEMRIHKSGDLHRTFCHHRWGSFGRMTEERFETVNMDCGIVATVFFI